MFTEADIISRYTRRQAIEDGVLVQLSGDGYEGDSWVPEMVAEAGIRFPVAMTVEAFTAYVSPMEGGSEELAPCQDIKGRLWDVLWMMKLAIVGRVPCRRMDESTIIFVVHVVPNVPKGKKRNPRAKRVELKVVCGPSDDGSPCLTVMLPEQD